MSTKGDAMTSWNRTVPLVCLLSLAVVSQAAAQTAATGSITCVARASLVDGEVVAIPDGAHPAKVFEFDINGNGVTAGRVPVNLSSPGLTANQVALILANAINSQAGPTFTISASTGANVVALINQVPGIAGNEPITEGVADPGFVVTGMSGGTPPAPIAVRPGSWASVKLLYRDGEL